MKKILLTGGNGFIGKNIFEGLRNIYELDAPGREHLDLFDMDAVEQFLKVGKYDVIIHAANVNTTKNKEASKYDSLNGNLHIFSNLEKYSGLYGKMLYFGSGAEYDMKHYVPFMKESYKGTYIPQDPYGFSKYIMSQICEKNHNIIELCLFGVYGKYEEWNRRFISNNICRNLMGLPITINQNTYFDYLYVEDLIPILVWFVENTPRYKHYNVCRGQHIDLLTLANTINEVMHTDTNILVKDTGWKLEYSGSNQRLTKEMGMQRYHTYKEGIRNLVEFYREVKNEIDIAQL